MGSTMTGGPGAEDAPRPFTDEALAAIGEYLPELRRYVAGQRILYTSLMTGFVVGLAARLDGYVQIVVDDGACWTGGRPALCARLGTLDRCRRGHGRPGRS